jgi:hypothetical protein
MLMVDCKVLFIGGPGEPVTRHLILTTLTYTFYLLS